VPPPFNDSNVLLVLDNYEDSHDNLHMHIFTGDRCTLGLEPCAAFPYPKGGESGALREKCYEKAKPGYKELPFLLHLTFQMAPPTPLPLAFSGPRKQRGAAAIKE
jgi:hypothetical protein